MLPTVGNTSKRFRACTRRRARGGGFEVERWRWRRRDRLWELLSGLVVMGLDTSGGLQCAVVPLSLRQQFDCPHEIGIRELPSPAGTVGCATPVQENAVLTVAFRQLCEQPLAMLPVGDHNV